MEQHFQLNTFQDNPIEWELFLKDKLTKSSTKNQTYKYNPPVLTN